MVSDSMSGDRIFTTNMSLHRRGALQQKILKVIRLSAPVNNFSPSPGAPAFWDPDRIPHNSHDVNRQVSKNTFFQLLIHAYRTMLFCF